MQSEGFRWHRAWQPPSAWPSQHHSRIQHNLSALVAVANRILIASATADGQRAMQPMVSATTAAKPSGAVVESVLGATSFVSQHGEIVPSAKAMRVQSSDGRQESSALIMSWAVPQALDGTIKTVQTFARPAYLQR